MSVAYSDELCISEVFALLGNERRLLVIRYLSLFEPGTAVEVRHIARVVRAIETDTSPRHVSTSSYESAYNSLIQTHLPRLATRGLIKYDEQRKEVSVTPKLDQYALISAVTRFAVSFGGNEAATR